MERTISRLAGFLQAVTCTVGIALAACGKGERSGEACDADHLDVTWTATIERGGTTTSERLSATLTPTNVTPEVFDSLVAALVRGRKTGASGVVWSVPAFNTSPGGIAVLHKAALSRGEVLRVAGVLDTAGWGLTPSAPRDEARAGVEAGDFVAHDVSGTIAVLETKPLALRLDLTARDSAGSTIRVRGDARFTHGRERRGCAALARARSSSSRTSPAGRVSGSG